MNELLSVGFVLALAQFWWAVNSWRQQSAPLVLAEIVVVYGGDEERTVSATGVAETRRKESRLELQIRNVGSAPAGDVRVVFHPPISGPGIDANLKSLCALIAEAGVGALAPGRTLRYRVAPPRSGDEARAGSPMAVDLQRHEVEVTYRDLRWRFARSRTRRHAIDLRHLEHHLLTS